MFKKPSLVFLAVKYHSTLTTPWGSQLERLALVFSVVFEEVEPGHALESPSVMSVPLGDKDLFLSMLRFFSFQIFWVGQRSEWLTSRKTRAPKGPLRSVFCCTRFPRERLWSALTCNCLMSHSSPGMIIEDFLLSRPPTLSGGQPRANGDGMDRSPSGLLDLVPDNPALQTMSHFMNPNSPFLCLHYRSHHGF